MWFYILGWIFVILIGLIIFSEILDRIDKSKLPKDGDEWALLIVSSMCIFSILIHTNLGEYQVRLELFLMLYFSISIGILLLRFDRSQKEKNKKPE